MERPDVMAPSTAREMTMVRSGVEGTEKWRDGAVMPFS